MQTKQLKKALILGAVLLLAGGGAAAFAHGGAWGDGHGYGGHMMGYGPGYGMGPGMMGHGPGYGMGPGMMGYGYNRGNGPELSQEQQDKLEAAQEKFWTENRKLRNQIDEKRDDLRDELAKDNPDAAKVTALQKEVSKLQGDFDQKAVQQQLEVRKIAPELFEGRGHGRGYGRGRGYGPGAGYCWQ